MTSLLHPHSTASRRSFIKRSTAFAAIAILPAGVKGNSPNERLQIAQIGVGGRGTQNLKRLLSIPHADVVALCDVDALLLHEAHTTVSSARTFRDYRRLFDQMDRQIDAVLVSTPDHMHAPIAMAAMARGKHVYCEKPLAHNVVENRQLRQQAESTRLVTQLGIQNAAGLGYRLTYEYVRRGLIGKISEVHVWSKKQWGRDEPALPFHPDPVPPHLDWNLWLGVAPTHDYKTDYYHPGDWRKLIDFGTGTLGDMGVHIFDTPYRALALTAPQWVRTTCRAPNGFSHPSRNIVEYAFPATRYTTPELKWTWYDGLNAPPPHIPGVNLPAGRKFPDQGCVLVGELGTMIIGHKNGPQTLPVELIRSVPRPQIELVDHHEQWVEACLGRGETGSPFSYGGPLCEALQLGVVANRFPGRKLTWDALNMKITNLSTANRYLRREYRGF